MSNLLKESNKVVMERIFAKVQEMETMDESKKKVTEEIINQTHQAWSEMQYAMGRVMRLSESIKDKMQRIQTQVITAALAMEKHAEKILDSNSVPYASINPLGELQSQAASMDIACATYRKAVEQFEASLKLFRLL